MIVDFRQGVPRRGLGEGEPLDEVFRRSHFLFRFLLVLVSFNQEGPRLRSRFRGRGRLDADGEGFEPSVPF
jgi:hypothetical protein